MSASSMEYRAEIVLLFSQSSQRIHYELKRRGFIEYDNEVYNIVVIHYEDGEIGVRFWDNNMRENLYEENITGKPVAKKEVKPAYPFEHIHEPNEETYFHRAGRNILNHHNH